MSERFSYFALKESFQTIFGYITFNVMIFMLVESPQAWLKDICVGILLNSRCLLC